MIINKKALPRFNQNIDKDKKIIYDNTKGDEVYRNERLQSNDGRRIQGLSTYQRGAQNDIGNTRNTLEKYDKRKTSIFHDKNRKNDIFAYAEKNKIDYKIKNDKLYSIIDNSNIEVVFFESDKYPYAGLTKGSKIYIDIKTDVDVEHILSHEFFHWGKRNEIEFKKIFETFLKNDELDAGIIEYTKNKNLSISDTKFANIIKEEILADYTAKYLSDYNVDYGLSKEFQNHLNNSLDKVVKNYALRAKPIIETNPTKETTYNTPKEIEELKIKKQRLEKHSEHNTEFDNKKEIIPKIIDEKENLGIAFNPKANIVSYMNDFYRNMENVFGKKDSELILKPFDEAKLNYVNFINLYVNKLKSNIVDNLHRKKESKDTIQNMRIDNNAMTSAYGRNNYDEFMKSNIKKGNLIYDIDEGIKKSAVIGRVQFPTNMPIYNNNIS